MATLTKEQIEAEKQPKEAGIAELPEKELDKVAGGIYSLEVPPPGATPAL